jgi:hypothetical protein
MNRLIGLLISGALIAGSGGAALAQQSSQQDKGGLKQGFKNLGRDTKNVAVNTGKTVEKTTKKVVHKGEHATSKAPNKVENKTAATK